MKKSKRICAISGVVFLVGLYILTLIFALIDSPWAFHCLKISIGLTILVPVLLWIYLAMFRYIKGRRDENQDAAPKADEKNREDF